ncbi:MAG: glucosamine-6-phosphate deaminase [Opitutus sp.]
MTTALDGAPTTDVSPDRAIMGERAARHVIGTLQRILNTQPVARVMFACAPSQDDFLRSLITDGRNAVDWSRVVAFHMDEYVGLPAAHEASFRRYLHQHLLDLLPSLAAFESIRGEAPDSDAESERYAALLDAAPLDLICLGIGENGHIAFNDPPVADFADVRSVKCVQLDEACRQQQVNDGCFESLARVPTHALTVTIPVFRRARQLSVVVPGPRKAAAVRATLRDPVSTRCPATILRTHPNAVLFLDQASAAQLR